MKTVQVTYQNILDGKRHTLIDDIDLDTATKVIERFGDKRDLNFYMPGLRIESMEQSK